MIVIKMRGIDPQMVREISLVAGAKIADLYETEQEKILFIGSEDAIFFNGVDQYGLHAYVEVEAPEEAGGLSANVARYLQGLLKSYSVHSIIKFKDECLHDEYINFDETYPHFATANNLVKIEEDGEEETEEEIYEGDVFENLTNDIEAAKK